MSIPINYGHHYHFAILVGFNPSDETQRELLLYLMMTSCDLSDQVKPFDSASAAAVMGFNVFFFRS
jgi:hypothetical protein